MARNSIFVTQVRTQHRVKAKPYMTSRHVNSTSTEISLAP